MKHLSFKDTQFIIEAIDHLIKEYNERLLAIEENEEDEDEASDLGNDCMFLESLRTELEESLSQGNTLKLPETSNGSSQGQERMSLDELVKPVLQLSIIPCGMISGTLRLFWVCQLEEAFCLRNISFFSFSFFP